MQTRDNTKRRDDKYYGEDGEAGKKTNFGRKAREVAKEKRKGK